MTQLDPSSSSPEHRHPIESIASRFAESVRVGRGGSIESVVESNPQHESELRDLLPIIQRLEQARQSHLQRPAGLATLGSSRPDRLGDFELVRQIGRGGMGVVFEAVQKSLGRKVAVKVLPKSLLTDDIQLRRFEREARTAGSLHHTNIVPVFGVGEDQGFHYYVMQRIDGRGLDRLLNDEACKLTATQVALLGHQAASALAYAHQQSVLHRDIKPANLIVNDQLELWVTDFGVSKAIESEAVTRTGDVVGTLRYMAPEQIVGDSDVRSDIYSLGVTLYELLAGRPAMDDSSIREALVARRPAPRPPRLRQLNPDVPRDLETVLHTAMSIDPASRYQTAEALEKDLQRFLDGEPISVRRLSLTERGLRWARRNPAVAALSALSMLLLAGVAVLSTIGFIQVQRALDREQNARLQAEATADLASGALDHIFQRFTGTTDTAAGQGDFSSTPALSAEAADLLEDLLGYYDDLAVRQDSDAKLRQSAVEARYAIGDIYFQLGHYDRAIQSFELSLAAEINNATATAEQRRLREARIRNRIGLAHRVNGNDASAEQEHQRALDLLTAGDSSGADGRVDQQSQEFQFELARTHYMLAAQIRPGMGPTAMPPLGAVIDHRHPPPRFSPGQPPRQPPPNRRLGSEDLAHLQSAIELLRTLCRADRDNVGYALALAASLRQLETSDSAAGLAESSSESIRLLRDLHQSHPNNDTILFELSETLADLSVFGQHFDEAELESRIVRLEEAVNHFELLCDANPNVPKYINAVVHTHFKLASLLERLADNGDRVTDRQLEQQAGISIRQAADRYGVLLRRHPEARGYRAWHAVFLYHLGGNALKSGLFDQAERSLDQSIAQWKYLIRTHPEEAISWHALPATYELLSHAQHRMGKHVQAEESMDQAEMSRIYRDF